MRHSRRAIVRVVIFLGFVVFNWGRANAQAPEVLTEAKVFEVDRSRLKELGIPPRTVSSERLESDFIINIPESSARALASGPGSRLLQTLRITTVGDNSAEFRIASRVTATQATAESQKLDVGFDFRLWTRVSLKREIAMTFISQGKIRNVDSEAAESLSPISGQAIRHEITTAEGAIVAIGGFITDEDTRQLSKIGTLRGSPLLNYLFSYQNDSRPELVVVLTPRIVRAPDEPVSIPPSVTRVVREPTQTTVESAPKKSGMETGLYTVQVGAFVTEAKARAIAEELSQKYSDVYVDTLETLGIGRPRHRVRVGHLPTTSAAKEIENQLRSDGFETLVFTVAK